VVTTYTYGALNLLTGVSYNNVSGVAAYGAGEYHLKSDSPGKGQIEKVTTGRGLKAMTMTALGRLQNRVRE